MENTKLVPEEIFGNESTINEDELPFTREQIQAAYALNLCTVSVSQIIDYNDLTILEQEYETILNNLNLENIPKDDALLEILKRLLETIVFFRIQEGEKQFIEKEYQQKMKNAIWTAVPNLALLVAGGNPVSMGISLASQVGIGYMNYRKNRNQYNLDRDKQLWKLQRSAMEQFEGLQQQLFETAWRLADKYHFPDLFRLTEKQIKQYNAILMDTDEVRKYERLESMKEHFAAYPPFWYYIGSTANAIANQDDLGLDAASQESFRNKAKLYFEYFRQSNKFNLLREDEITASCNLEYADLLDPVADKAMIEDLLDEAVSHAGNSWDVRQLCAVGYLKIGQMDKAALQLRQLVNEDYNGVINAQLLSTIYVEKYISEQDDQARSQYQLLSTRLNPEYLFPMPENSLVDLSALHDDFLADQRNVLKDMYRLVLKKFAEKYEIMVNQIIPLPPQENPIDEQAEENDSSQLYLDLASSREERLSKVKLGLGNKNIEAGYRQELADVSYSYRLIEILNQMFSSVCLLECAQEEHTQLLLAQAVKEALHDSRDKIQQIEEGLKDFSPEIYGLAQEITFKGLTEEFFGCLQDALTASVESKNEMQDFAIAETNLSRFCTKEGLELPERLYKRKDDAPEGKKEVTFFTPDLLNENAVLQNERAKKNAEMLRLIRSMIDSIVQNKEVVEFYTQEDPRMNRYFYNKALQAYQGIRCRTLAVLDDRSRQDCDLVFTTEGVLPVIRGKAKNTVPYREIDWTPNARKKELRIGVKYSSDNLGMDALYKLILALVEYAAEPEEA